MGTYDNLFIDNKAKTIENAISALNSLYIAAEKSYSLAEQASSKKGLIKEETAITNAANAIEENYKKLKEIMTQIDEKVQKLAKEINNSENFMICSYPTQVDSDEIEFKVKIAKKGESLPENPSFTKKVNTYGGLRFDFSVGPVFTFGKKVNDEISYLANDSSSVKFRKAGNMTKPSAMAMMHITQRSGGICSFGGMFGVGVGLQSLTNISANFVAGVTAAFGRKDKLFLSAGYMMQQISCRKEGVNTNFTKGSAFDSAIYTERVYKAAPFVSISYAIGKRQ